MVIIVMHDVQALQKRCDQLQKDLSPGTPRCEHPASVASVQGVEAPAQRSAVANHQDDARGYRDWKSQLVETPWAESGAATPTAQEPAADGREGDAETEEDVTPRSDHSFYRLRVG